MTSALAINDLKASVVGAEILKGLDLDVPFGEVHAIMGPNGSGKSTLCHVLSGHAAYEVSGSARIDGEDLLGLDVSARARKGLMQAFQYPTEIRGVRLRDLVQEAADERGMGGPELDERIAAQAGGEKKRSEIFQMAVLGPKVVLLDEIDSGLDIDAVRQVAEAVEAMRSPDVGILMITHYSRILKYLTPDRIHVMIDGRIVESGGPELADELETGGYDAIRDRLGIPRVSTNGSTQKRPADFFTETPFDI
jgi:Fe-S cluster assembly ATP-binding protein